LLGAGLDPAVPIASGHGRVVGRGAGGGLWVLESGRAQVFTLPGLAPHAGLLVLAFGIIAIVADRAGAHRVVRLDPAGGAWEESASFAEPVLPDARPLQFDPTRPAPRRARRSTTTATCWSSARPATAAVATLCSATVWSRRR
jgi:hypothetical protein